MSIRPLMVVSSLVSPFVKLKGYSMTTASWLPMCGDLEGASGLVSGRMQVTDAFHSLSKY